MLSRPSSWWIILILIFLPAPFLFSGEIYHWTDERGTVHFTDDASKVPQEYWDQVESREVDEETLKEPQRVKKPESKHDRVNEYLQRIDERIERKRRLEKKISELEEELRLSEERLRKIEEYEKENFQYYMPFIDRRTGKLVPRASPYYDEKRRLEREIESINAELRTLRERVSELTRSL
jgi:chromosome segregation ATPase